MTWPPPPPSSDPWATGPAPDSDADRDDGAPAADPVADPLWEPLADPVADSGPDELSEPVEQPVEQPVEPPTARPVDQPIVHPEAATPVPQGEFVPPPAPVSEPPPPDGGWSAAGYGGPPPVVPRAQVAPPQQKKPVWLIAAAVLGVVVIGVVVWLLVPSGDGGSTAASPTTPSPTRTADPRAEADLRGLLPRGYAADACEMRTPPAGALAEAACGANLDPGGPPSATYTITADDTALDAAFNDVVEASSIVTCPGNIQSPGPWRRNATPQKVSGVLFCGLQADRPVVAWTNTDEALVAVVKSGPRGPGLDQLYTWWSSHS
ncbi:hypothetical protein [Mycolicibacterium monacense]|uniref:hypothetical protein n=1 Tax=Mycolicibacterium monacense TaxID=85693 RepID=UPI0007EB05A7|nr:hypothetical protein [Mycolicibacterium monacense]OBF50503.1 hypothetical protein A5778_19175 [Mycolicibacterium monacense]